MGRGQYYRWNSKDTTAGALGLSISLLKDNLNRIANQGTGVALGSLRWSWGLGGRASIGYVVEGRGAGLVVRLQYTTTRPTGEKQESDYPVRVVYTVPHYGGRRWWWICPLQGCGRRVGKLFKPGSARYFGCRHCYQLTYESTREDVSDRYIRRLWALRDKVGGGGTAMDSFPDKPRFMHWETYARLHKAYDRLRLAELRAMNRRFRLGVELPTEEELDVQAQERASAWLEDWRLTQEAEHEREERRRRPTLGDIAAAAGVPCEFAREARREGLLREDKGRGTRRRRYRRKLASWLEKLYLLRGVGYSWDELRAWTRRRFQPGYEHERRWPAGFREPA